MTNDPQAQQRPLSCYRGLSFLFGATICLGAFLLFQVQPLEGKIVLPWFGGTPMVWTTCLLFYQALLLAGYLYAHALVRFRPRVQASLHMLLLGLCIAGMAMLYRHSGTPIVPADSWKPVDSSTPAWRILRILLFTIGLPYFVLSTTSSLLQAWFSRLHAGCSPYRFYALSNVGSFVGLVTYPVLVEPALRLRQQAGLWTVGFGIYALVCAACAVVLLRRAGRLPLSDAPRSIGAESTLTRPSCARMLAWLVLAAVPVAMMMATTNQMSADVAPIPLLWILGLGIYLLSFVLAFSTPITRAQAGLALLMFPAAFVTWYALDHTLELGIAVQLGIHAAVLFLACTLCHGEVYRLRPHPEFLTLFYLPVALGGVIGGLSVAVIAPALFSGYWEFHLALAAATGVAALVLLAASGPRRQAAIIPIAGAFLVLLVLLHSDIRTQRRDALTTTRNFYGALRVLRREVRPGVHIHSLMHGRICHGLQYDRGKPSLRPTAYFGEHTGIGLAFEHLRNRQQVTARPPRVGLLGLGIGTLCAYGRRGDTMRYYEINPEVERIARDTRYFTYLRDCPASVEVVPGDARISLQRELQAAQPQSYDLLVLDVFSGDAVPTHLLTVEAVGIYLSHLRADGVLAMHISNAYLDLEPVAFALARAAGLEAIVIRTPGDKQTTMDAKWILLTRSGKLPDASRISHCVVPPDTIPEVAPWTDDFCSLYQAIRL